MAMLTSMLNERSDQMSEEAIGGATRFATYIQQRAQTMFETVERERVRGEQLAAAQRGQAVPQ